VCRPDNEFVHEEVFIQMSDGLMQPSEIKTLAIFPNLQPETSCTSGGVGAFLKQSPRPPWQGAAAATEE